MNLKIPLLFGVIFLVLNLLIVPTYATDDYVYPNADCKVYNNLADTNYGSEPTTTLGNLTLWYGTDTLHIGFYKFNMSDFDPDLRAGETVSYLNFFFDLYVDYYYSYREGVNYFQVGYSTNQSWQESLVTWNNQPSYTLIEEIVNVMGQDQYFTWDLRQISLDVSDAISNAENFTLVIKYYGSTIGFNPRFREYGGISFDPRIRIEYEITTVGVVYEREPSLATFPIALGEALHIGDLGGRLFASMIFIMLFMLPTAYVGWRMRNIEVLLMIVGFPLLAFLIAISYLPVWVLVLVVMGLAMMYANKIKGWVT